MESLRSQSLTDIMPTELRAAELWTVRPAFVRPERTSSWWTLIVFLPAPRTYSYMLCCYKGVTPVSSVTYINAMDVTIS